MARDRQTPSAACAALRGHTSVRKTAAVSRAASIRADEELLDRVMSAIPQLPVGPSAGAAAAVLILGSDGAAAAGSHAMHPRRRRHEAWSPAPADLVDLHERLDGEWRSWRQALER